MKISNLIILIIFILITLGGAFYYYLKVILPVPKTIPTSKSNEVRERRILAFGDSLTYGYGLDTIDDSYPSQLQKKLLENGYNYKVINFGVSGETTSDALKRLPNALSYTPDLVILEFNANDYLQNLSPENAAKNLDIIIKTFDDKDIKIVLLNVIEPNSLLSRPNQEQFARILPELSKKYDLPLVGSMLNGVFMNPEYTLEDRLHPNKAGYTKVLNENIWPILKKELIKPE